MPPPMPPVDGPTNCLDSAGPAAEGPASCPDSAGLSSFLYSGKFGGSEIFPNSNFGGIEL